MQEPAPLSGILLELSYDGHGFSGFARQKSARTIQGELDGAIRSLDPKATPCRGSSRTDAGVHARSHPVAFDTHSQIPTRGWALGLSRHLPDQIAVRRAARVSPGLDPRRFAVEKTYRYLVLCSRTREPFFLHRAWRVGHRLNQELMQQAALDLLGEHDFRAFRGAQDMRVNTVRRIVRVEVRSVCSDPRLIEIVIAGNAFLYNMVRIMVGSLVDIGRGRLEPFAMKRALSTRERRDLGITAPPDGLYLERVQLAEPDEDGWP